MSPTEERIRAIYALLEKRSFYKHVLSEMRVGRTITVTGQKGDGFKGFQVNLGIDMENQPMFIIIINCKLKQIETELRKLNYKEPVN